MQKHTKAEEQKRISDDQVHSRSIKFTMEMESNR